MRIHGNIEMNGRHYSKGDYVPPSSVFPFFLFHMLLFGGSGFFIAYFLPKIPSVFLYVHGGIAIMVYLAFYLVIFGRETIKWLFINAALGIFGVIVEIDLLLNQFDKSIYNYPFHVSVIPALYYILYTFLIRQAFLEFSGANEDETKKNRVEKIYLIVFLLIYSLTFFYKQLF